MQVIWHYDERQGFDVGCLFFVVYLVDNQSAGLEVVEKWFARVGAGCYVVDVVFAGVSAGS